MNKDKDPFVRGYRAVSSELPRVHALAFAEYIFCHKSHHIFCVKDRQSAVLLCILGDRFKTRNAYITRENIYDIYIQILFCLHHQHYDNSLFN